jgi:soluble lytic murein transglycosylase-like protein
MLLATAVLAPATAFAQVTIPEITIVGRVPQPAGPVRAAAPVEESQRAALLKDIEAIGSTLLSQTQAAQEFNARYQPRLNEIKNEATNAKTAPQLAKAKTDLADWKSQVLKAEFAAKPKGMAATETFSAFSERKAREIEFVASLQQSFALQRAKAQTLTVQSVLDETPGSVPNPAAWSHAFDNTAKSSPMSMNDGSVKADMPVGAARYKKLRDIAVGSWGAPAKVVDAAIAEAMRQNVDPALVLSVIWQESRFHTGATSPVGARGLMQVMPDTGRGLGVSNPDNLYDMKTNLRAGIKYLRNAVNYLKLDLDLSDISDAAPNKIKALLASYNAGCGAVSKWLRQQGENLVRIPYAETRTYVRVIGDKLASLGDALRW